jgi:hypothetical protein
MLDTPLVRGERVGLAEVGGVRLLDMVRNKDGRTMTGTSYLNSHVYSVRRLQAQGTGSRIRHYIH